MKSKPDEAMRRVLIIAYYFPPSGGSGVQRTLKFVHYLPSFGWQPTVLTVDPADAAYPDIDQSLLHEIPPGVSVERTHAWDPYALYARLRGRAKEDVVSTGWVDEEPSGAWQQRLARWIRANLFIPDARVGWVPFALWRGRQLLRTQSFSAVYTTGPPHSTHLIGWWLSRRTGTPWVADFRDPWTDISYYHDLPMTALARRIDAGLQRMVLQQADAVVTVSHGFARLLQAHATPARLAVIPNGFDARDVRVVAEEGRAPSQAATAEGEAADRFVIAHVGTLAASQHAPGLVAALAQRASGGVQSRFCMRFVGAVDQSILSAFEAAGLASCVEVIPYVPHAEALAHMRAADVLLSAVQRVPGTEGVLPAKTFEYLSLDRPVLGIGAPQGDLARLLRDVDGGQVFAHDDAAGIGAFLDRIAVQEEPFHIDHEALLRYERRRLTGRLAGLLDVLSESAMPVRPGPSSQTDSHPTDTPTS